MGSFSCRQRQQAAEMRWLLLLILTLYYRCRDQDGDCSSGADWLPLSIHGVYWIRAAAWCSAHRGAAGRWMVQSVHNCELIQSSVAGTRSLLEEHMRGETSVLGSPRFHVSMAARDVANEQHVWNRNRKSGTGSRGQEVGCKEKIEDSVYFQNRNILLSADLIQLCRRDLHVQN